MKAIQPRKFHPWKALWVLTVVLALIIFATRRDAKRIRNAAWAGNTMGTTYSIQIVDARVSDRILNEMKEAVDAELRDVNQQMSTFIPSSEISEFNQSTSMTPFKVSAQLAGVVRFSITLYARSHGAFDPTVGPLVDLWGFGPRGRTNDEPTGESIAETLRLIGGNHLTVYANNEIQKSIPGLQLDLGAVAKGFGVDQIAALLQSNGMANVFVEIGGEVAAFGHNAQGGKWKVGVQTPLAESLPGESIEAIIELSGNAIATSGDYRNYFTGKGGRRFSHILDPKTGRPISHNLVSVSVVADTCMVADGLATAVSVLGPERGLSLIEYWRDAEVLFITRNADNTFSRVQSSGFAELTGYEAPPETEDKEKPDPLAPAKPSAVRFPKN